MAKLLRTVLLKRVPKSGMPSTRLLAIGVTTPVWISAAAALVTAGVIRLVAPVWSSGPNGDGATSDLQSAWADAGPLESSSESAHTVTDATNPAILMIVAPLVIAAYGRTKHGVLARSSPPPTA